VKARRLLLRPGDLVVSKSGARAHVVGREGSLIVVAYHASTGGEVLGVLEDPDDWRRRRGRPRRPRQRKKR